MKKIISMLVALCVMVSMMPVTFAEATITSVLSGNGEALSEGISTQDGSIKINFSEAVSNVTSSNVKLNKMEKVDMLHIKDIVKNNFTSIPFNVTTHSKTKPVIVETNIMPVSITGTSGQASIYVNVGTAANNQKRMSIFYYDGLGMLAQFNGGGNQTNLAGNTMYNLKAKFTDSKVEFYFNDTHISSKDVTGIGTYTSENIFAELGFYDQSTDGVIDAYIKDFKIYEEGSEANPLLDEDLCSNETCIITKGASVAEDVLLVGDEVPYTGSLSNDGLSYTMDLGVLSNGADYRLAVTGLTSTDTVINFTANDSIASGKSYASFKAGAGYDLTENPVLYYKNPKIVAEFDNAVTVEDGDISVGKYELSDYTNFKFTQSQNAWPSETLYNGAHAAGKNIVYEQNIRIHSISGDGNVYADIYAGSTKLTRIFYTVDGNQAGANYGKAYLAGGSTSKYFEPDSKWHNIKFIISPTGYRFLFDGEEIGSKTTTYSTFNDDLKVVFGTYLNNNYSSFEYDLKNIRVYYEDGTGDIFNKEFDRSYSGFTSSSAYLTLSSVNDQPIISEKIAITTTMSDDSKSCEITLPELEKNQDYQILVSGVDGIAESSLVFRTDEYFAVDGAFSVSSVKGADGRNLTDTPYLSNANAEFDIVVGNNVNPETVNSENVELEKVERADMLHIKDIVKSNYTSIPFNVTTHSKTKPVIVEINIMPVEIKSNQASIYVNVGTAANNQKRMSMFYYDEHGILAQFNGGGNQSNLEANIMYNLKAKFTDSKVEFYFNDTHISEKDVEGIGTYTSENIFAELGFYDQSTDGVIDAYIKDFKIYEEGSEANPLIDEDLCSNEVCITTKGAKTVENLEYASIPVDADISYGDGKITVEPVKALEYLGNYRLNVTEGLKDNNGNSVINPVSTEFVSVYSDDIYAEDMEIVKTATGYTGTYKIVNFTNTATSAVVVLAVYEGNKLIDMAAPKTVSVPANDESTDNTIVYTTSETLPQNAKAVLYVWENMTNILPVSPITVK